MKPTVLLDAIDNYTPDHIFALVSGGDDSVSMLHYVQKHITAAVHIDTGIGIPETRTFVENLCAEWDVPLLVYEAAKNINAKGESDPQIYADIVRQYGFPTPPGHRFMYARLKERCIRMLHRDYKGVNFLVSGVRSAESVRRMGNVDPIQKESRNRYWIAPIHDWTESFQRYYMRNYGVPRNPVKVALGMSGECLCGAYAKKGELERICKHYPETGARIKALEHTVLMHDKKFTWGWEDAGPGRRVPPVDKYEKEYRPLCNGCSLR